ncbi:2Fe-2S iron-sulfur cluster-binding protein [Marinobacterium mangrovicola]|uniref:N-methylglutamate dehydrogenase subunit C n=1 Tax=Marinobacterium mangrovicola TaxID=1476959 RepID=A0A4R1GM13_9GAMM|nr:2Fe-2S iron-sulfur cluster-binding protein [Marinobacterium mangrovicola]TCK07209.1 N-methylglutamate dehydrogenase subunit C [Marinobacterium mangrovicola]
MKYRLDPQPLEWIDRRESVSFRFEGQSFSGFRGDSLSSALLASGQKLLGRSFKYHRPRGVLSMANHDVNALFQSDEATNIRGDVTPVSEGLDLRACNVNGSLANDKDSYIGLLSRFLPVGFYYKAFHKPKKYFPFWEKIIREKAGLGEINTDWTATRQPKQYGFCDVLVIGAGASGMSAALTAADAGADVVLVDENPHIGGSLDYQLANVEEAAGVRADLKTRVRSHANIRLLEGHYAAGWYTDHYVPLVGADGIVKMRAEQVIMATGVMEQPSVFRNNDLPGVMLASAAQRLITRYAVKPGQRAVVLTGNDEGYRAALDLLEAGIEVAAVVDLEWLDKRGPWAEQVKAKNIPILEQSAIYEAKGKDALTGVVVGEFDGRGCDSGLTRKFACDLLLMSVGWAPASQMLYQSGCKLGYDKKAHQILPRALSNGLHACGRLNGAFTLEQRLADGERAAKDAMAQLKGEAINMDLTLHRDSAAHSHDWPIIRHPKGKNFLDIDEDLQLKDLINAAKEGFDNIELMKRFSTNGMGPSQGKHSNMNGIRVLAEITGKSIDETGSTTARPMFHPVPVSAMAGRRFRPERLTPMHQWHLDNGVQLMEAGQWMRPEYYLPVSEAGASDAAGAGQIDQRQQAILQEVQAVRSGLGLIDVSTLGKIEVMGPDAARLLDVVYTMKMSTIKIGMTRYALAVDDSGVIIDDGIVGRIAEDRFYVTATTSHAAAAFRTLSLKIQELGLNVRLANLTGSMAAMNLAGPASRKLLSGLTDVDLSEANFPYLGMREGTLCGYPVRLIRVGFVGELGYEIHLSAAGAMEVWETLMREGQSAGIRPFGVEAQRILRLEKGHIIVGQDTDGLTNPFEANMSWAVPLKSKPWFTGKPSLALLKARCQRKLIGFRLPQGFTGELPKECHLIIENGEIAGRITSIAYSPSLGRTIGLAMVDLPLADEATELKVRVDGGAMVSIEPCPTPFYDADGARQTADLTEVA